DPDQTRSFEDEFGNEVWEFQHALVAERLRFSVGLLIEHAAFGDPQRQETRLVPAHGVPPGGIGAFVEPSRLVDDSPEIRRAVRRLESKAGEVDRVTAIGEWVYTVMEFCAGVTDVETPASVALEGQRGVCQDY